MDWRKIILLSLLGIPVALLGVFGFIPSPGVELGIWFAIVGGLAWVLGSGLKQRAFFSGFMTGLLMGVWSHILYAALWSTYLASNPEIGAQMAEGAASAGMSPQVFQLLSGAICGVFYGLVLGLLTLLVGKLTSRSAAGTVQPQQG